MQMIFRYLKHVAIVGIVPATLAIIWESTQLAVWLLDYNFNLGVAVIIAVIWLGFAAISMALEMNE